MPSQEAAADKGLVDPTVQCSEIHPLSVLLGFPANPKDMGESEHDFHLTSSPSCLQSRLS